MTITLNLEPGMEAYLREKATREGQATEAVALALLTQAVQNDASNSQEILLMEQGINPVQATELRAKFASFADEWNQPGMDVYDDYDAAKANLYTR
jgi:plasmid stability protein